MRDKNKFGVFIRSTGERTENLCLKSCLLCVNRDQITFIKNQVPAYVAYQKMFELAIEYDYDWYLGLDADVVLKPFWLDIASKKKMEIKTSSWFVFTISVLDQYFGIVDRGNHFYNGQYSKDALPILMNKTKYFNKPETSIRHELNLWNGHFGETVIGYHGYEQYYADLFYCFWLRVKRQRDLDQKYKFLTDKTDQSNQDLDYQIVQKAWQVGKERFIVYWIKNRFKHWLIKSQSDTTNKLRLFRNWYPILEEKDPLEIQLKQFYADRKLHS